MAKLVSKTYGEALFELALENGTMDGILTEIRQVQEILAENEDFERFLTHPKISKDEKISVMENVFKGKLSDDLLGFLVLLLEKDRYGELADIFAYYESEVKRYRNIGIVKVSSAFPVTEEQKKQIEDRLLSVTDFASIETEYHTDPSLIGGIVIRIGDRVVDGSIRNKLAGMAKYLM